MVLLLFLACSTQASSAPADVFARYLDLPIDNAGHPIVSDGLGLPTGPGWATLQAGQWAATKSAPVLAAATGVVVETKEGVELKTILYENNLRHEVIFRYQSTPALGLRGPVLRGASLGNANQLKVTFLLDGQEQALDTLQRYKDLPVPQQEAVLVLISHAELQLGLYKKGQEVGRYAISLGQRQGAKERRGDNRSPQGMYYITEKSQGPFTGDFAAYFGGHWMKINYPNPWDAARGVDQGLISVEQQRQIYTAWHQRKITLQNTGLGGGIGLHGWAYEWDNNGPRYLSWGCIVLHLKDVGNIYDALPVGTMVVLF